MKKLLTSLLRLNNIILKINIFIISCFTLLGCSDVRLKGDKQVAYSTSGININVCTTKSDTIRSNLKFIFVMDRSGSNQVRYDAQNNPLPGTDPNGVRRFNAILEFVDQFQDDPYVYWSMVNFSTQVLGAPNAQAFTNNKQNFYNFVNNQMISTQQIDAGWTNYMSSLDKVIDMIRVDVAAAKQATPKISSNYVVFFVSDGEPIVNGNLQATDNILNKVRAITAYEDTEKAFVEGVQVNTAYYFEDPASAAARTLLNEMSIAGNGDFLEFAAGQNIDFSRFAIPIRISKFDIKEVWISNVNTTWDNDLLKKDSDGDGLSDDQETALGSNIYSSDSDGNGVNDSVEYRLSGNVSPCKNSDCSPVGADPYTTCRSLELPAGSATKYADTDKDFLNDCEEKLMDADKDLSDSNEDYIPDDLAFKNGIKVNGVSNAGYLDPDNDNVSDYQEIKYNTPLKVPNSQATGHKTLRFSSRLVSSTPDQDCYQYTVNEMVTKTRGDRIRVYIMENTKTLNEKRIMKTAEKTIGNGNISFENIDFK